MEKVMRWLAPVVITLDVVGALVVDSAMSFAIFLPIAGFLWFVAFGNKVKQYNPLYQYSKWFITFSVAYQAVMFIDGQPDYIYQLVFVAPIAYYLWNLEVVKTIKEDK